MENRPIFDPYLFVPNPNIPPNVQLPSNVSGVGLFPHELSPKEFYENQYFYYRYLNEYLDYTLKRADVEKRLGSSQNKSN